MKKAEWITGIIAVIGIVLNMMLIKVGSVITIMSLSLLADIYMFLGFSLFNGIRLRKIFKSESYIGLSALRIVGAAASGFVFSMPLVGIMFKIQAWPGAESMLLTSIFPMIIIAIIAIVKYIITKAGYYKGILIRIAIIGSITLVLLFIPRDKWIAFKYRNHPAYVEACLKSIADPDNDELREKMEEEWKKMHNEQ